jgi:hypothetical protein
LSAQRAIVSAGEIELFESVMALKDNFEEVG